MHQPTNTYGLPPAAGSVLAPRRTPTQDSQPCSLRGLSQERDTSELVLCALSWKAWSDQRTQSLAGPISRDWLGNQMSILSWGCISFWTPHSEHCLPLVKGSGKICIVSKLGIRRFLGEQWNQSRKSWIAVVVYGDSDHLWIPELFKNLRKICSSLKKNNICVIFADSVSKVMKLIGWPGLTSLKLSHILIKDPSPLKNNLTYLKWDTSKLYQLGYTCICK